MTSIVAVGTTPSTSQRKRTSSCLRSALSPTSRPIAWASVHWAPLLSPSVSLAASIWPSSTGKLNPSGEEGMSRLPLHTQQHLLGCCVQENDGGASKLFPVVLND